MKEEHYKEGQGPGSKYGKPGKDKIEAVEITPAFSWTCDECGVENFNRALITEEEFHLEEGEDGILHEMFGEEESIIIPFVNQPERVICRGCRHEYATFSEFEHE